MKLLSAPALAGGALLTLLAACGGLAAGPGDGGSTTRGDAGTSSGGSGAGVDSGASDVTTADGSPLDAASSADVSALHDGAVASVSCPQDLTPATCNPGQYCCVVGDGHAGTQTDTCEGAGSACAGTPVRCAVPADCPAGEVCCGTQQADAGAVSYVDVSCAASCTGANQRIFCDPASNTCPVAHPTCALSTILPGYDVCNQ
jgi:hypothetical protein